MKNFKKLIKEAYLGNPLSEEDRATRVDKMLSGKYKDEDYKDSERYADVRADLEGEINEENEKFEKAARDEYGKPWMELSIAQKQELLSYMNRETEKQFQTDYERRRRGDYSDDMEDGMTDYQRRRMDEEFKKGDKVTYLGNPGEITFVGKDQMDRTYYSVSYDKGNGKTKASNLYNKGGEIKAVEEGTCGYGEDGVIGDKPAGAHLQKEDMNDPILVKARAAKMAAEKEKAKQAELDKKYGSSFMDKLDAEISLKQELQDLKDEREQLMMDMEQEAEPEGGEIADRYGSRLNDIDAKMALIKSELEDLRMYESVNESKYRVEYEDKDDNRHYIEIKASSEEEAEQKSSSLDGFRTIKSIELVKEDLQLDVDLYSKENPAIFSKADEKVQVTIPGGFGNNEGDTALEKALAKLGKKYASYKVKDVKELNEDEDEYVSIFHYYDKLNKDIKDKKNKDEIDEELFTPNEIGDEAIEKESNSAAYESLQETLRKKLQDRLK